MKKEINAMEYPMNVYEIELENGKSEWCVEFPDLPECVGGGDTYEEAIEDALQNKIIYLSYLEEEGIEIPKPSKPLDLPSGKFALRMPRKTHKRLIELADEEGVSLNAYINSAISEKIGRESVLKCIYTKINDRLMDEFIFKGSFKNKNDEFIDKVSVPGVNENIINNIDNISFTKGDNFGA